MWNTPPLPAVPHNLFKFSINMDTFDASLKRRYEISMINGMNNSCSMWFEQGARKCLVCDLVLESINVFCELDGTFPGSGSFQHGHLLSTLRGFQSGTLIMFL